MRGSVFLSAICRRNSPLSSQISPAADYPCLYALRTRQQGGEAYFRLLRHLRNNSKDTIRGEKEILSVEPTPCGSHRADNRPPLIRGVQSVSQDLALTINRNALAKFVSNDQIAAQTCNGRGPLDWGYTKTVIYPGLLDPLFLLQLPRHHRVTNNPVPLIPVPWIFGMIPRWCCKRRGKFYRLTQVISTPAKARMHRPVDPGRIVNLQTYSPCTPPPCRNGFEKTTSPFSKTVPTNQRSPHGISQGSGQGNSYCRGCRQQRGSWCSMA
jgi:hypothetical protein